MIELITRLLESFVVDIVFTSVGRIHLRYRDREKIEKIKNEKYAGDFSNLGRVIGLNFFAGLFGLLLLVILVVAIIGVVRHRFF